MGVVYEAFDQERRIAVALKSLNRFDGDGLARFRREFRALQGLAHPNLVTLDELFFEDDQWFFTMELLDGLDFVTHVCGPRSSVDLRSIGAREHDARASAPSSSARHVEANGRGREHRRARVRRAQAP